MMRRWGIGWGVVMLGAFRAGAPAVFAQGTEAPVMAGSPEAAKKALVKVVAKVHGVPVRTGAGIFVSNDGQLVTAEEVIRPALESAGGTVDFVSRKGGVVSSFKISRCDPGAVCLLKLPLQPSGWLSVSRGEEPREGAGLSALGHKISGDFVTGELKVKGSLVAQTGRRLVVDLPPDGSFVSGSALLNRQGALEAVLVASAKGQAQAVPAATVNGLLKAFTGADEPRAWLAERNRKREELVASLTAKYLKSGFQTIQEGRSLAENPGFISIAFGLGNTYQGFLPGSYRCSAEVKTVIRCRDTLTEDGSFEIRIGAAKAGTLVKDSGRTRFAPRLSPPAAELKKEGEWARIEATLTPSQKEMYLTRVDPLRCYDKHRVDRKYLMKGVATCSEDMANPGPPESFARTVMMDSGKYLFAYHVYVKEPALRAYYQEIPWLFLESITLLRVK